MRIRATLTIQLDGEKDIIDSLATQLLIAIPGPVKAAGDVRCVTVARKDLLDEDGNVVPSEAIVAALKASRS